MNPTVLSRVYESTGPFASVLTDVSHDSENGAHEHELRVRAACDRLAEQGAPDAVVAMVRERLGELVDRPAPVGRVLVATPEGIVYDELTGIRVDQPVATWAPFPDLAAWIEHRDSSQTFVLAIVDHEGGDVALYDSDVPEAQEEASVGGETRFVHKVPVGGWSALRYQHNTDNVWGRNAQAVFEEIQGHVRRGHTLVLVAGDPQSRGILRGLLEDTRAEVVELESGSRSEDGGDEALQQAIREALLDHVVARRLALTHELKERLARDTAAVTGIDGVADAFVRGQVETLVLDPAAAAELELDVSEHPGLALGAATPDGPVRADQALVAAAVLTDAAVSVGSSATLGGEPAAALLRWDQEAVGTHA
jgi:hypothetical protein